MFLTGLEEGICPHSRSLNEEKGIEEERRLVYVGMTRARKTLTLTRAVYRRVFGNEQQMRASLPSRFLAEIPGVVVSATPDSVQLAVTPDNQQSNKADFTVNMKTPLREAPKPGEKVTYVATFDSYTSNPPMIILKDGELKAAPKAPVHHTTHHSTSSSQK